MAGERSMWRPSVEFYKSNQRSARLREVSLGIVKRSEKLLHDPEVEADPSQRSTLYAELEMLGGTLIEMGIKPKMNMGLPLETYQADPVIATEYLASQLLPVTGKHFASEGEVAPIVQELNESDSEVAGIIDAKLAPQKFREFMIDQHFIGLMGYILNGKKPDTPDDSDH
jgi:hypothetical protein